MSENPSDEPRVREPEVTADESMFGPVVTMPIEESDDDELTGPTPEQARINQLRFILECHRNGDEKAAVVHAMLAPGMTVEEVERELEERLAWDVFDLDDWTEIKRIAQGAGPRGEMARCRLAMHGRDYAQPLRTGKRGRPKSWHRPLQQLHGRGTGECDRTRQNEALATFATGKLSSEWEPAFAWFWNQAPHDSLEATLRASCGNGFRVLRTHGQRRTTVLVELARFGDTEMILACARALSKWPLRSSTRKAVEVLRGIRLGDRRKKVDAVRKLAELADRLHEQGVSWFDLTLAFGKVSAATMQLGIVPAPDTNPETVSENAVAVGPDTGGNPETVSEIPADLPEGSTHFEDAEPARVRVALRVRVETESADLGDDADAPESGRLLEAAE